MISAGFYEETIVLKDLKIEEINKFYISEDLSESDRVNYILKKGQPSQRSTLISNLPTIVHNFDMTSLIVTNVIEDIELWNKDIQICFAISLKETVIEIAKKKFRGKNYESLVAMIVFHYMKSIVNLEKNISDEYAFNFNEMVAYLNEHFRVTLTTELIEYATSLGKFGQSTSNRKFSTYFCTRYVMQISDEYKDALYKRFLILCGDADRIVKLEVSYEIRYILQELDEYFVKKSFCPVLEGYLNENDMLIRSEAIVSMILNIHKFEVDFVNKLTFKISDIFENEDSFTFPSEFNLYIKIFTNILEQIAANIFFQKHFLKLIKGFIKKYFLIYAYEKNAYISHTSFQDLNLQPSTSNLTSTISFRYDYIIEKFHLIALIFRNQSEINFLIDLFTYLINQIFESCGEINQSSNQTSSSNNCVQKTSSSSTEPDYKLIFCENFYKISGELNKQIINKNVLMKFLQVFSEEELRYITPHVLKNFDKLLFAMKEIDHEDFFTYIFLNFSQIELQMKDLKDWRTVQTIIKGLCNILDYASQVTGRFAHEEFFGKLIAMVKGYLKPGIVLGIQIESIRLLVQLIKYSKNNRCELIKFPAAEFFNGQKSYYRRRLYRVFIEECFEVFSISYVKEIGVLSNYISMLSDIPLIVCSLLKILTKIFPLVSQEEELNMQLSVLFQANSENKIKDYELSKIIQEFSDWLELFQIHSKIKSTYQETYMKDKIKMNDEIKIRERENAVTTQSDVKEKKDDIQKRQLRKPSIKKTFTNSNLTHVSILPNGSNVNLNQVPSSSTQSVTSMFTGSQNKKGQTNFITKIQSATVNYNSASTPITQNLPVIARISKKSTSFKVDKVENKSTDSLDSARINSLKSELSKSFKITDLSYEKSHHKIGLSNPGMIHGKENKLQSPQNDILAKVGLKSSFTGVSSIKSQLQVPYMSLNSPKTLPRNDPVLSLSSSLGIKHYQTSNNTIVAIKVKSNSGKSKNIMK